MLEGQRIYAVKMGIAREQGQLMLNGKRGNPNVIVRDRLPLRAERSFDSTVYACGGGIAIKNSISTSDEVRIGDIPRDQRRCVRSIE